MKILIVEDDILIASHLKEIIEETDTCHSVHCAHSEEECKRLLTSVQPDFVILDIRMESNDSGIQLASFIQNQYDIPHAFITAQSDKTNMALAFKTIPIGYVVKPFRHSDIHSLLMLATQKQKTEFFVVKTPNNLTRIPINDILFLKAENNYIDVYVNDRKFTVRLTLSAAQRELTNYSNFIQTHRSYIINRDFISIVTKTHVVIQKFEIPVSKAYAHLLEA